jgi:transposase-like protein
MSIEMDEEIKRWTARRKSALVLEIIQGKTTVRESSRQFDPSPSEIESWVDQAKAGMDNALKAKPEDIREQYGRSSRRCRKRTAWRCWSGVPERNGTPCWRRRTRHDPSGPAGLEGGRVQRADDEALSLARCSAANRVLQAGQDGPEGARSLRRADQATDRGGSLVRLPDRSGPAAVQQEHGAAHLPDQGMAGPQAGRRSSTADRGAAIGCDDADRALGDGRLPRLGGLGRLADLGFGYRL